MGFCKQVQEKASQFRLDWLGPHLGAESLQVPIIFLNKRDFPFQFSVSMFIVKTYLSRADDDYSSKTSYLSCFGSIFALIKDELKLYSGQVCW